MRHKWKNNICITCGCKREYISVGGWGEFIYTRSGITFESRPDCIDWDIENAKTID